MPSTEKADAPAQAQSETVEMSTMQSPKTVEMSTIQSPKTEDTPPNHQPPAPSLSRSETADALGPDGATLPDANVSSEEPVLRITLMLTTGARHPYLISRKYLASRKVTAIDSDGNFDPREMSAYKLKELIWTDWRTEWEPKPRDPAAIRLIILGRMLEDKSQLKDSPFTLQGSNVVHMTVKPADLLDDDPEGAGKSVVKSIRRGMNEGESAGCCRCVIQ